jgi:hypothetical protein
MKVTVMANGKLELWISEPVGPVQEAALNAVMNAVNAGRSLRVETHAGAIAIVLEGEGI